MAITNTEEFCISCHEMRENVYQEYRQSVHFSNRTGVRATCPDCHVPREWIHKVRRKIAATSELAHKVLGSINTKDKFNAKRLQLAQKVWTNMQVTDSRECRNCHATKFMDLSGQTVRGNTMHDLATGWGKTCIDCHKGITHKLPDDFNPNPEIDDQHARMEAEDVACELCHEGMAQPPAGDGWE